MFSNRFFWGVAFPALVLSASASILIQAEDLPQDTPQKLPMAEEPTSPQPESPLEHDLPTRAIPILDLIQPQSPDGQSYVPLFRLTRPYYDNIFAARPPDAPFIPDPSTYRAVTAYEPPQGLLPQRPKDRLFDFLPFVGVAESFDSNLNQTPTHAVGDLYTTLSFGGDMQLGSPDSTYAQGYDTILAAHARYLAYMDFFHNHPDYNAFNQKFDLETRIGRSDAIWRPYFSFSDITGNNYLSENRDGRLDRQRLSSGFQADYRLTSNITWGQNFSFLALNHPKNNDTLNTGTWRSYQEIGYQALPDFNGILWTEYEDTKVSRGSRATEFINGFGWRGHIDPRLFSELLVGWDSLQLSGSDPYRRNLSGVHVAGHTSFEWSPRLRLTLKYDRGYAFNETVVNDNYVNNTLQIIPEIFLGGNWYVDPYVGFSYDEFEASSIRTFEIRPELEVAYAFGENNSRVFGRVGYDRFLNLNGASDIVEIWRYNLGMNWNF